MNQESRRPLLSVLMSVFNAEKYLKRSIDSILQQSFNDFELIISDDGSVDGSRALIDAYDDPRIIVSHNIENQGKVDTINRLFNLSKGKYITIHDADDYSHYSRFDFQVKAMSSDVNLFMCGTSFHSVDEKQRLISTTLMPTEYIEIKKKILRESCFHGPTIVFKREIVDHIGGLYRKIRIGEDVDFTMRVAEIFKCININLPLYVYSLNPDSITKAVSNDLLGREIDSAVIFLLAEERRKDPENKDSWMKGIDLTVRLKKDEVIAGFSKAKSKLVRHRLGYFLSQKMYKNAFFVSFHYLYKNPLTLIYFREFLYVLRQCIASFFKRKPKEVLVDCFYDLYLKKE